MEDVLLCERFVSYGALYRSSIAMELDGLREGGTTSLRALLYNELVDDKRDESDEKSLIFSDDECARPSEGTNEPGPPYCFLTLCLCTLFLAGAGSCAFCQTCRGKEYTKGTNVRPEGELKVDFATVLILVHQCEPL